MELARSEPKARAVGISQGDWDVHKECISQMYLVEGKTLKEVRAEMLERGFSASNAQYIRVINNIWGLKKNLSRDTAKQIDLNVKKRKQEGKDTIVHRGGRVVSESELMRKRRRYPTPVFERFRQAAISSPEEDFTSSDEAEIRYRTPSAHVTPLHSPILAAKEWAISTLSSAPNFALPQSPFQFTDLLVSLPSINSCYRLSLAGSISDEAESVSAEWISQYISRNKCHLVTPTLQFQHVFDESVILKETYSSMSSDTSLAKHMVSFSKTTNLEEWITEVSSFTDGPSILIFTQFLKHFIVRLSNNIDNRWTQEKCVDHLMQSAIMKENGYILHRVFQEATLQGIFENPNGFNLAIQNLATHILYSAARIGDIDIVKTLSAWFKLDSLGTMRTFQIHNIYSALQDIWSKALQYAIEYEQRVIYTFLLKLRIEVGLWPRSDLSPSVLWLAVLANLPDLVGTLLRCGAYYWHRTYDFKFDKSFRIYLNHLRDNGISWAKEFQIPETYSYLFLSRKTSAIDLSVALGYADCLRVLAQYVQETENFQNDKTHSLKSQTQGLLYFATANKDHKMMEMIIELCKCDVDEIVYLLGYPYPDHAHHTPLSKAVCNCDIKAIQILLRNGARLENIDLTHFEYDDLETVFDSRCRASLEALSLFGLIDTIDALILSRKTLKIPRDSNRELLHQSNEDIWSWSCRFRQVFKNIRAFLHLIKSLLNAVYGFNGSKKIYLNLKRYIHLYLSFFEWIEVRLETKQDSRWGLHILVTAKFYSYGKLANFPEVLNRLLQSIYLRKWSHISYDVLEINPEPQITDGLINFRMHSKNSLIEIIVSLKEITRQFPKGYWDKEESTIESFHQLCFPSLGAQNNTSNTQIQLQPEPEYSPQAALDFLLSVETNIDNYLDRLEDILEWSLRLQDKEFHLRLCKISIANLSKLTEPQVSMLLRLIAHCDFYCIATSVLRKYPQVKISAQIICEATWFSGLRTFKLLLDHFLQNTNSESEIAEWMELPIYIGVAFGQLYKVIELLHCTSSTYSLYLYTVLDMAVLLGRLDMTKLVLEAATKLEGLRHEGHLKRCFYAAEWTGNISIIQLLDNARNSYTSIKKGFENLDKIAREIPRSASPDKELLTERIPPEELLYSAGEYSVDAFAVWTFPNDKGPEKSI